MENNEEEYNSFIYKWVDTKTNKYYIGSHIGKIDDGYKFGGIDIKKEYKKRPYDFHREILSFHLVENNSEIRKIEEDYLKLYDVENDLSSYNRTNKSYGGYHKKSSIKRLLDIDDDGLNDYQRAAKKMAETRKKNGSYKTSKIKEYRTKKNNLSKYNKTKEKISESLKGSKWITKNNKSIYVNKNEYEYYIKNGWVDGRNNYLTYEECSNLAAAVYNIFNIERFYFSDEDLLYRFLIKRNELYKKFLSLSLEKNWSNYQEKIESTEKIKPIIRDLEIEKVL